VKTTYSFYCQFRETYVKTKKPTKFYESTMQKLDLILDKDSNSLITSLCFEHIGEFMTLNLKDATCTGFHNICYHYKLT